MPNTEVNVTSTQTNLAQSIVNHKTPIAVAIAEYVRSLMHGNPDTPYVFGAVKQGVQVHVWELLPTGEPAIDPGANDSAPFRKAA